MRVVLAELQHRWVMAGYWVRPYDSHLDGRRWRWQKSGCQQDREAFAELVAQHPETFAALFDAEGGRPPA